MYKASKIRSNIFLKISYLNLKLKDFDCSPIMLNKWYILKSVVFKNQVGTSSLKILLKRYNGKNIYE